MTVLNLHEDSKHPVDWLRISGLSGSFGLHVAAILLLAVPMALPSTPAKPEPVSVSIREATPPPRVFELPPEPVPLPHPPKPTLVQPTIPVPSVVEITPIAVAVPDVPATDSVEIATPPVRDAVLANVTLAYESIVQPTYPPLARRRGLEGTVLLAVHVGRDGLPIDAEVRQSSGSALLDRAAREAVLRWRFRPVRIEGVMVEATGLVPIRFDLQQG